MTFEEKYQILGTKNTAFDGIYFTAVKTTGIFCRPSCRARTPKVDNVLFYDTVQEALENGFRPCKVCKPLENVGQIPNGIQQIIEELQANPHLKITDDGLKERGIEPHTMRRWFKSNYKTTFHRFQRMLRMNYAFNDLKKGKSITHSAFDNGYESLSGFNASYLAIFGSSVRHTSDVSIINILRLSTPIGAMIACASNEGICYLGFVGQKKMEEQLQAISKEKKAVFLPGDNPHLTQLKIELEGYFEGNRKDFSVSLDIHGTDFRKSVWKQLLQIPYGTTFSYKQQATALNNQKAIRAVATANGANRISILIPCHRVIGSNGSLTGYAGGIHKKKWLLAFEQSNCPRAGQQLLDL